MLYYSCILSTIIIVHKYSSGMIPGLDEDPADPVPP